MTSEWSSAHSGPALLLAGRVNCLTRASQDETRRDERDPSCARAVASHLRLRVFSRFSLVSQIRLLRREVELLRKSSCSATASASAFSPASAYSSTCSQDLLPHAHPPPPAIATSQPLVRTVCMYCTVQYVNSTVQYSTLCASTVLDSISEQGFWLLFLFFLCCCCCLMHSLHRPAPAPQTQPPQQPVISTPFTLDAQHIERERY